MLYPVCPTCSALLSNIQLPYTADVKDLCNRYNIDIEAISNGTLNNPVFDKEKEEIMNKYVDKDKYCCKMRLGNFTNQVELIRN
jgi:hypothetical protein